MTAPPTSDAEGPKEPFIRAVRDLVRRRARVGAGATGVVLAATAAVVFLSRPVYRAEARLKIGEPPPSAGVSPTGGLLSFLRTGGDPFANDLEVLASRTVTEAVVRDAGLYLDLGAPRGWYRDSLLVSLALVDTTAKAAFEARWTGDGIAVRETSPDHRDVGRFQPGEPARFGGMRIVFAPRRPGGPDKVGLRTVPVDEAVRRTSGRIKVRRTRREANVLEIQYVRDDPQVARDVVASVVRRFLDKRIGLFERESGETMDSLRTVAAETHRELRAAEDSLAVVQRATGLVAPDAQSEALVERYETVYAALETARAERDLLDAQLVRVRSREDRIAAWSTLVANPRFLENSTVGDLLERLTTLEEERTALLSERTASSLDARTLDAQVTQLDEALQTLVSEYRTGLAERIQELTRRVAAMDSLLEGLPARAVELGRRQRSVRILSEVLVLTEQRLREEELRQALAVSNVQIVDPPALRYRPVWPRKKLGLAVGMVLALGAGALAMVVAERADPSIRSAARVRALAGAPVLAATVGRLTPAESAVVRAATGERCALVTCAGSDDGGGLLSSSLGDHLKVLGPVEVDTLADAADLARHDAPVILAVRIATTSELEVARTAALVRQAGGRLAGVLALCRTERECRAVWG